MGDEYAVYRVVINREEQYSIVPIHEENPDGWKDAGKSGSKEECLAYIREVWTDMRPLSMRKKMDELLARQKNKPN
jgi:MbtH protein